MKSAIISLLIVLAISMFLGIVAIGIGVGSAVTSLDKIAGPVVCSDGQLVMGNETYSWRPGQGTITLDAACVNNATGEPRDVTTPLQLVAGVMYGFIIFILLMLGIWALGRRLKISWREVFEPTAKS